jgi:hypothetical protein
MMQLDYILRIGRLETEVAKLTQALEKAGVLEKTPAPAPPPQIPEVDGKVLLRPIVGPSMTVLTSWKCPVCEYQHERDEIRNVMGNPTTVLRLCGDHKVHVRLAWDWYGRFDA